VHRSFDRDTIDGDLTQECGFFALRIIGELLTRDLQAGSTGLDA
jgi:hypothetical protein